MTNTADPKHQQDAEFATYLATETGKHLVALRNELVKRGFYGWDLKDAGDAMAQEFLMTQLREHRPNDAVLSEEATDSRNTGGIREGFVSTGTSLRAA